VTSSLGGGSLDTLGPRATSLADFVQFRRQFGLRESDEETVCDYDGVKPFLSFANASHVGKIVSLWSVD